jgi:GNAT superfamily N-acetyltransferase
MPSRQEALVCEPGQSELIRLYQKADFKQVARLWARINRELAPPHMREQFEQYIATALADELGRLLEIFSPAKRSAFWVVVSGPQIIGTFGIESRGDDTTELRRMYLDREHRGRGIAQRMLGFAEAQARQFGFTRIILSTAEIQIAALRFYQSNGYVLSTTEVAKTMSTKTVGAGLLRYHFEKSLEQEHFHC